MDKENNADQGKIITALESLTDLDLKAMSEEEMTEFKSQVGKLVNEFYISTNIEIRNRKKRE